MKRLIALLALTLTTVVAALAQNPSMSEAGKVDTPAKRSMQQAGKAIEKNPANYDAYNALAMALARRARETSDVSYYAKAEEALQKSFALKPDNFGGLKVKTWVLLGKHEFSQALQSAKALNKMAPDDVLVYGFLADANVELGNYDDAERAAQWMLDLRAGNLPGLTRASYLREIFGDVDGSIDLMEMAYQSTPPAETEDRAWILTQIAHLKLSVGKLDDAEKALRQALTLFPGYHYALGSLAKVRIAQERLDEAAELLRQRYQAAPHAENLYDLACALESAGHAEEARRAFAEFEVKSLRESQIADNSNHELIFYYADHAQRTADALRIARREIARRHDIHTLDAYAWALHINGQYAEARKHIETALKVGVRDANMLYHAGAIALALKDRAAAERYWKQSAELASIGSDKARTALASLPEQATRAAKR